MPGLLIFTTVMGEFHFVVTSIWRSYLVGAFAFAFVNVNLLVGVTCLVSVYMTYWQLQSGNWKWWWQSFFTGAGVGIWAFVYLLYIGFVEFKMTQASLASDAVYFLYAALGAELLGCMVGAISFLASLSFVTLLYKSSKSD